MAKPLWRWFIIINTEFPTRQGTGDFLNDPTGHANNLRVLGNEGHGG